MFLNNGVMPAAVLAMSFSWVFEAGQSLASPPFSIPKITRQDCCRGISN
jgi:hypothetical protein